MQKAEITLTFDEDKLEALAFYLAKEKTTPQKELLKLLDELYQQKVPADTREYLERKTPTAPKAKRPVKPSTQKPVSTAATEPQM